MRSFKSSHHQKFEPEKLWCGHIFNQPHPQPPLISKVYPFLPPAAGGLRGCEEGARIYFV
ncbi:MAG: hypothetical protein ACKN9K_30365, partial [Dolichospermum sp.]